MSNAILNLQKAIYAALSNDAGLTALIGAQKVFDFIPENKPFPFVQIGNDTFDQFDTHTSEGVDASVLIETWTRDTGREGAHLIMREIYRILHKSDLEVDDFSNVSCMQVTSAVIVDPDSVTYHGIQRYRIILGGQSHGC